MVLELADDDKKQDFLHSTYTSFLWFETISLLFLFLSVCENHFVYSFVAISFGPRFESRYCNISALKSIILNF